MQVATKFSKETYLYWYELMQLIRQFELKAEEMYKMAGKIRGFFHAYIGQEGIGAGCMTATARKIRSLLPTEIMDWLWQKE
jgi:pyruvate dehydrogenase E1 component alpha subunit